MLIVRIHGGRCPFHSFAKDASFPEELFGRVFDEGSVTVDAVPEPTISLGRVEFFSSEEEKRAVGCLPFRGGDRRIRLGVLAVAIGASHPND